MLLIIIGMVWAAAWRDEDACPTGSISGANTDYRTIKVNGSQLNRLIPGDTIEVGPCQANVPYILSLKALTDQFPSSPQAGPHFRIAPDLDITFAKKRIQVIVRARASANEGAKAFEVNYATGPEGESGWKTFTLSDQFSDYTLDYNVPASRQAQGVDFLGLRPVIEAGQTSFEVESLTLLNLGWANPADAPEAQ